jgi:NAD(P)-dependent dehydrogenase (short-subunit alcohol dehydrogenase family)
MNLSLNAFSGKVVVVTGGTSGLGFATACYFAEHGAKVYALGLDSDKASFPSGLPITSIELDVTDQATVDDFFASLQTLHFLITAAGITLGAKELQPENFSKVIDVNLMAVHYCVHKGAPVIASSGGGAVVNFASMAMAFAGPSTPGYVASKGAIVTLTRQQAAQWVEKGIRVNAVAPGWVDSAILRSLPETFLESVRQRTPMKRFGLPQEIAKAIGFLCSDDASFITGVTLPVDGGYMFGS